jgi:hypothetical protein
MLLEQLMLEQLLVVIRTKAVRKIVYRTNAVRKIVH